MKSYTIKKHQYEQDLKNVVENNDKAAISTDGTFPYNLYRIKLNSYSGRLESSEFLYGYDFLEDAQAELECYSSDRKARIVREAKKRSEDKQHELLNIVHDLLENEVIYGSECEKFISRIKKGFTCS